MEQASRWWENDAVEWVGIGFVTLTNGSANGRHLLMLNLATELCQVLICTTQACPWAWIRKVPDNLRADYVDLVI